MTSSVDSTAGERFVAYRASRDRALRDELIVEHLGLARALARRYSGRGDRKSGCRVVEPMGGMDRRGRLRPDAARLVGHRQRLGPRLW